MSLFDLPKWLITFPKVPDPPSGLERTFVSRPNAAFVPTPGVADSIANQVPSRPFQNPAFNLRGAAQAYSPASSQQNVMREILEQQRQEAELAKQRASDVRAVTNMLMTLPGVTTSDESKAIDTTIRSGTTGSSTESNVPAIATGALTTGEPSSVEYPSTRTRTSTETSTTTPTTTPSMFSTTRPQETSSFFNYNYGGYYAPKQKQIR